jgi:hypothetical protein
MAGVNAVLTRANYTNYTRGYRHPHVDRRRRRARARQIDVGVQRVNHNNYRCCTLLIYCYGKDSTSHTIHINNTIYIMQLIYGHRRIMDINSNDLKSQIKTNWVRNTIKILKYLNFTCDTAEFMIERIENFILFL